jgi:hypothetical protein
MELILQSVTILTLLINFRRDVIVWKFEKSIFFFSQTEDKMEDTVL